MQNALRTDSDLIGQTTSGGGQGHIMTTWNFFFQSTYNYEGVKTKSSVTVPNQRGSSKLKNQQEHLRNIQDTS